MFDYVNTIIRGFKDMPDINDCFCSWPSGREEFNRHDYSNENINRIKNIIRHLESKKERHKELLESIKFELEEKRALLKKLEEGREKNKKVIETTSNEAEFDS